MFIFFFFRRVYSVELLRIKKATLLCSENSLASRVPLCCYVLWVGGIEFKNFLIHLVSFENGINGKKLQNKFRFSDMGKWLVRQVCGLKCTDHTDMQFPIAVLIYTFYVYVFLRLAFKLEWLFYLFSFVIVSTQPTTNKNTNFKHNNVDKVGLLVDSTFGHLCSFCNKNGHSFTSMEIEKQLDDSNSSIV